MWPSCLCHNSICEWISARAINLPIKDLPCKQYRVPFFVPLTISLELLSKRVLHPCISICPIDNQFFLCLVHILHGAKSAHSYHLLWDALFQIPSIEQSWLCLRYICLWLPALKVVKHSLIGVTWNDAPEPTIHVCDKASFRVSKASIRLLFVICISCAWIKNRSTINFNMICCHGRISSASDGSSMTLVVIGLLFVLVLKAVDVLHSHYPFSSCNLYSSFFLIQLCNIYMLLMTFPTTLITSHFSLAFGFVLVP